MLKSKVHCLLYFIYLCSRYATYYKSRLAVTVGNNLSFYFNLSLYFERGFRKKVGEVVRKNVSVKKNEIILLHALNILYDIYNICTYQTDFNFDCNLHCSRILILKPKALQLQNLHVFTKFYMCNLGGSGGGGCKVGAIISLW